MKMKYFDRAALREVRNRMEEALKKVSDDLWISFEIGKISCAFKCCRLSCWNTIQILSKIHSTWDVHD